MKKKNSNKYPDIKDTKIIKRTEKVSVLIRVAIVIFILLIIISLLLTFIS